MIGIKAYTVISIYQIWFGLALEIIWFDIRWNSIHRFFAGLQSLAACLVCLSLEKLVKRSFVINANLRDAF